MNNGRSFPVHNKFSRMWTHWTGKELELLLLSSYVDSENPCRVVLIRTGIRTDSFDCMEPQCIFIDWVKIMYIVSVNNFNWLGQIVNTRDLAATCLRGNGFSAIQIWILLNLQKVFPSACKNFLEVKQG